MKQLTEEVSISSMNTRIHILHTSQIQSEEFTSELYRCKPCRYVLLCDEREIQMIMRKVRWWNVKIGYATAYIQHSEHGEVKHSETFVFITLLLL